MNIIDLSAAGSSVIEDAAVLLFEGFREHWPGAWPDIESARREVRESLEPGRISRVALDEDGSLAGWIGGISAYDGLVWELYPLVVRPDRWGQGVGRALVAELEARVAERGALTLHVGTDDMDGMTSLSGVDLYPDVLGHLARIRNLRAHSCR